MPDGEMDVRLENPAAEKTAKPFLPWVWIPLGIMVTGWATAFAFIALDRGLGVRVAMGSLLCAFAYFGVQCVGRLFLKQWIPAGTATLRLVLLVPVGFVITAMSAYVIGASAPIEDHFADNLTIPDNIEVAPILPEPACEPGREMPEPKKHLPIGTPLGTNEYAITLADGGWTGKFIATYRINAGEPGVAYLKAYEVTRETRLSESHLETDTAFRMPWSNNPKEFFTGEVACSITEGDWGKPYAARFEVWFKPDSGAPERKLAERVFKIEGWMR